MSETVKDVIAMQIDSPECGSMTYWCRSGDPVNAERWKAEHTAVGCDPNLLPEMPSPLRSLRNVMLTFADRETLVRPLGKRSGWALVNERREGTGKDRVLHHTTIARVLLNEDATLTFDPPEYSRAQEIRDGLTKALTEHDGARVSSYLVDMLKRLKAVSLRPSGGFYFVHRDQVPAWLRLTGALEKASDLKTFRIPALRSADAAKAVADALAHECGDLIAEILTESEKGKLTTHTVMLKRVEKLDASLRKVTEYERLFNIRLDDVRARIDTLSESLVTGAKALEDQEKNNPDYLAGVRASLLEPFEDGERVTDAEIDEANMPDIKAAS